MKKQIICMEKASKEILISEAYKIFRRTKVNNNVSDRTIKHYDIMIDLFTSFLGGDTYCNNINRDTIEEFIEFLKKRNECIKATSINSYLKDLRTILYFFMERGYTGNFPVALLKEDKEIKQTYTSDEIDLLLQKPNVKKCKFSDYRNWVITCYLLCTGNRLGSVCELRNKDIDFDSKVIHLRKMKMRKAFIMPLSIELEKILIEYMQYRKGEAEDYLFCNRFGDKLQESSLNTAIYRYNHEKGVNKTSVHLYRHTFAKSYLTNGGDLARLQGLLCHSTPTMSLEYAQMFDTDLDYHFNERNPLDNHLRKVKNNKSIEMIKA